MSELTKAMIFLVLGMIICFTYILHKNQYQMYWNGQLLNFRIIDQTK